MVSKLTFKGDNKKKKRKLNNDGDERSQTKKLKSVEDEEIIMINNKLTDINKVDAILLESGWSTANVVGDLNGPAILIPLLDDGEGDEEPRVISIGEGEKIEMSDVLNVQEKVVNFNSYEDDSVYQRLEPKSSCQVFVLNSVLKLVGSKEEIRDDKLSKSERVKISLKCQNDFNLTTDNDDLKCDSKVLTENEIFQFIKVKDGEKIRWRIQTLDGRKLYVLPNGVIKLIRDEEDLIDQLFIVRVHIENTVVAKKIKLLKTQT